MHFYVRTIYYLRIRDSITRFFEEKWLMDHRMPAAAIDLSTRDYELTEVVPNAFYFWLIVPIIGLLIFIIAGNSDIFFQISSLIFLSFTLLLECD